MVERGIGKVKQTNAFALARVSRLQCLGAQVEASKELIQPPARVSLATASDRT